MLKKTVKPKIRGNRRALESWFTEKRTPISKGKAYRMFNRGKIKK